VGENLQSQNESLDVNARFHFVFYSVNWGARLVIDNGCNKIKTGKSFLYYLHVFIRGLCHLLHLCDTVL